MYYERTYGYSSDIKDAKGVRVSVYFLFLCVILCSVSAGYYAGRTYPERRAAVYSVNEAQSVKELVSSPIIDRSIVDSYKQGYITKQAAMERIERNLNFLSEQNAIGGWNYSEGKGQYRIILSSGAVFHYNF